MEEKKKEKKKEGGEKGREDRKLRKGEAENSHRNLNYKHLPKLYSIKRL